jgi:hypothetical protein
MRSQLVCGLYSSALIRTSSWESSCRERGPLTASLLNANPAKTTWEPAPEMLIACHAKYGAPEAPVIGHNEDNGPALSEVGWNRVRSPLAPRGEGVFVFSKRRSTSPVERCPSGGRLSRSAEFAETAEEHQAKLCELREASPVKRGERLRSVGRGREAS